ncbi:hypothetical protein D3C87_1650270 [compost metagenome]
MIQGRPEARTPDDGVNLGLGPVRPDDALGRKSQERPNRVQHAAFSGLAHGRNHDDVAKTAGQVVGLLALLQRLPARSGPFEKDAAVHVIGQE